MPSKDRDPGLRDIELLSGLKDDQLRALAAKLTPQMIARGDCLVRQGDPADALFVVVSGRFAVTLSGKRSPVAEIGPGQPVGEIAFISGGARTATVSALRDSLVMRLDRDDFDALSAADPGIWKTLALTLASRVTATTAATQPPPDPLPRTIALIRAGQGPTVPNFARQVTRVLGQGAKVRLLDASVIRELATSFAAHSDAAFTRILNDLEADNDFLLLLADDTMTPWTEKCLRHADLVLAIGRHDSDPTVNAVEQRANSLTQPDARRLVLLHEQRSRIWGTRRWLEPRDVAMHHHVCMSSEEDIERLCRFITGTARGLVACGGGALCPTHVGIYKALREAGAHFDIMGGTSAGSAMVAAFIMGTEPDDIIASIHDMFVQHKAMHRYTLPRYSLLDHTNFDTQLQRYFGGIDIEDLWLPYYAVSTNLSRYTLHQHRRGDLWTAIRASASIPVLLPPIYTTDGEMLVDGGLLDNVPIRLMHDIKSGPNVVVSFLIPELERFQVDYSSLPSRSRLLLGSLKALAKVPLPAAPGLVTVLMRSLLANRQDFQAHLKADDVLLVPPIPKTVGMLDWHRYRELYDTAYKWARDEMTQRGSLPSIFTHPSATTKPTP